MIPLKVGRKAIISRPFSLQANLTLHEQREAGLEMQLQGEVCRAVLADFIWVDVEVGAPSVARYLRQRRIKLSDQVGVVGEFVGGREGRGRLGAD